MVIDQLNFSKLNGLVPAIVQDARTKQVLMVGFMNREAAEKTLADKRVTFWSRTKQRLWQKGETSGNVLDVVSIHADCDNDSLLIYANPRGPVCHTGTYTCFGESEIAGVSDILVELESVIAERKQKMPEGSYTTKLFKEGMTRIAQKVGEEGVEVVIASLKQNDERLAEESADLLYHLMVLLQERGLSVRSVLNELQQRRK
ncbi:MAG TPA: bifunctional phosphoribosyl-AMP cyclohydrolase/phosphoribosyl-ATP diphosphatase HisIE [Bacteroidota bacterium]|nr:bifunctional phosphoribosyl-AMP cyclohydrolase/phosphoribosyl-ATP diphosphatase HisIE [Bacteroidota bacterium]